MSKRPRDGWTPELSRVKRKTREIQKKVQKNTRTPKSESTYIRQFDINKQLTDYIKFENARITNDLHVIENKSDQIIYLGDLMLEIAFYKEKREIVNHIILQNMDSCLLYNNNFYSVQTTDVIYIYNTLKKEGATSCVIKFAKPDFLANKRESKFRF